MDCSWTAHGLLIVLMECSWSPWEFVGECKVLHISHLHCSFVMRKYASEECRMQTVGFFCKRQPSGKIVCMEGVCSSVLQQHVNHSTRKWLASNKDGAHDVSKLCNKIFI